MEQDENNKIGLKDKIIKLYNFHKFKIHLFFGIIIISIISIFFFKISNEKKNNIIAENYIKAGILLSAGKNEESKNLYEEIILNKNKFYSILSLNTIIEENLESDEGKILNYFDIVKEIKMSSENKDILIFKKALYLLTISEIDAGNKLLKDLINRKSQLKTLAEEIINK